MTTIAPTPKPSTSQIFEFMIVTRNILIEEKKTGTAFKDFLRVMKMYRVDVTNSTEAKVIYAMFMNENVSLASMLYFININLGLTPPPLSKAVIVLDEEIICHNDNSFKF